MAAPKKSDPNKYAKNAKIKAESPLQTAISAASFGLMIIGMIGIAVGFFKETGPLKSALSWLFESTNHMMFIPVIIVVGWFLNRMMSSSNPNESKKSGNLPMYIMMAIGAYFLFKLITTGEF
jgi:Na+/glutamate symporter